MQATTPRESFFRILAGLFLLYSAFEAHQSKLAIEIFKITAEQQIWYAAWLHIFSHLGIVFSCLLLVFRVKWGLFLLILVIISSKAIGFLTGLDNGVLSFISVAGILFLGYAMIFLKSYLKPWKNNAA